MTIWKQTPRNLNRDYWGANYRPEKSGFGIEIELEGVNLPQHGVGVWQAKPDQSLRGGMEYVTNGPVPKADIASHIKGLRAFISSNGGLVQNSFRCSTHFHLNVADDTIEDILGMFVVYTAVEPLFIRLSAPERDCNHFCLPSYATGDLAHYMRTLVQRINLKQLHQGLGRGKYSSLNLDPIISQGSIEFRTLPASLDGEVLTRWATWIENIQKKANDCKDKTFGSIITEGQENPGRFAATIFSGELPMEVGSLIDKGLEHANDLVIPLMTRDEKVKEETKDPFAAAALRFADLDPRPEFPRNVGDWGMAAQAPAPAAQNRARVAHDLEVIAIGGWPERERHRREQRVLNRAFGVLPPDAPMEWDPQNLGELRVRRRIEE